MLARIATHLGCTEAELWQKISEPRSLQFVASPLLSFVPAEGGTLAGEWTVGLSYPLKLYFLKVIPLGRHTIRLVEIDKRTNTIVSQESGLLARVWNHTIRFQQVSPGLVRYTDEIEIQAGWLTPLIWAFAQVFYRHRQRRWKALLRRKDSQDQEANWSWSMKPASVLRTAKILQAAMALLVFSFFALYLPEMAESRSIWPPVAALAANEQPVGMALGLAFCVAPFSTLLALSRHARPLIMTAMPISFLSGIYGVNELVSQFDLHNAMIVLAVAVPLLTVISAVFGIAGLVLLWQRVLVNGK
ncbi:MAG TPA: hypothetical protein PKC60_12105 [Hydrogenophaga sp.]|uniref:hypothetical protein n=1 Tax=Hydrogenophaga sp. TaxID=1904254 RepID=UPI002CFDF515|nr:hypothetical protein [Hydrogenophaga sp.]HMN93962.1 hypothetical protein [Hydrogenophaga sp.]HMP11378.1 hypothetical protein [Hydrogenophaga sp.]